MKKIVDSIGVDDRLDNYIKYVLPDYTRSSIKKYITEGYILLNDKKVKAGEKLRLGDVVTIDIPEPKKVDTVAEDIPLDIIYEDSDMAIINKSQGMVVHPACGNYTGTLVNALLYNIDNLSGINGEIRPGIVHRLDKDTSGLLVIAKNDKAHNSLSWQIQNKSCRRIYRALVSGGPKDDEGEIITYIGRSKNNRKKMAVVDEKSGKLAHTKYTVLKRYRGYTFMEFELKTGRTHQIRVHTAHMGYPIVGDKTYGFKDGKFKLEGQLLHAYKLIVKQPSNGEIMTFTSPIPKYFEKAFDKLIEK